MTVTKKKKQVIEFGDFQTPMELARQACRILAHKRVNPSSIIEPTCGAGNFLIAALDQFKKSEKAIGLDTNPSYVKTVTLALQNRLDAEKVHIICGNFFETDWPGLIQDLPEPILVIGNPPWVTNAELGSLGSSNLPKKYNFAKHSGLDAMTGKSNFDISEWMLMRILEWLDGRNATMAMLCKTAVARKVLVHAWKNKIGLKSSHIYLFDASKHFDVSVDACFLVCHASPSIYNHDCSVYENISKPNATNTIGFRDGTLVAEISLYNRWKHLQGEEIYKWRSGVKHDCAKVMELWKEDKCYRNGFGELVELEDTFLYPMLKSSDVANGSTEKPKRWMLVTQKNVGDKTRTIEHLAPKTWNYLKVHAQRLDRRASSIYKKRPRFSVFGVGPYTFAPWKVAISGFYKKLNFKVVGQIRGKPIVLDDTSYFISCQTKQEAECLASLLNSPAASKFFHAFVFWDAKRPITVELLRRLDLSALARELGKEATLARHLSQWGQPSKKRAATRGVQRDLFPVLSSTK